MSGALSFAEIAGQHVELLPARTVLTSYSGPPDADGGFNGVAHSWVNGDVDQDASATSAGDDVK